MHHLHLEKKGSRGLAIAESFVPNSTKSVLAGLVMRHDFVIDGFVFGHATLEGDDATHEISDMYKKLERADINYVIISGVIISMYNIIDIKKLYELLKIPIIGVTWQKSQGIKDAIVHHFPKSFDSKIKQYDKLGPQETVTLHTAFDVHVRREGCSLNEVQQLLDHMTLQGSVPEPLRVAQILARSIQKI